MNAQTTNTENYYSAKKAFFQAQVGHSPKSKNRGRNTAMIVNDMMKAIYSLAEKPVNNKKGETDMAYATPQNTQVGDGVTCHGWSDSHAYTVVAKTATTITIKRDKATLDPNFTPEIIPGGFLGHCVNQNQQSYTYETDPDAPAEKAHFSKKLGCYMFRGHKRVTTGRLEFYDYNF